MHQYVPDIDQIISDPSSARRDAVHIAVGPIEAGERLYPGMKVKIIDGKIYLASRYDYDAAVSPFIDEVEFVEQGQFCWIMMKPNTITSLRHLWTHDKFKPRVVELQS